MSPKRHLLPCHPKGIWQVLPEFWKWATSQVGGTYKFHRHDTGAGAGLVRNHRRQAGAVEICRYSGPLNLIGLSPANSTVAEVNVHLPVRHYILYLWLSHYEWLVGLN